ncbi:unnamed protein product, partial [Symbiodinium necroappetens]
ANGSCMDSAAGSFLSRDEGTTAESLAAFADGLATAKEQLRRTEQRVPHLYGQLGRERQEGSSGGSTYEAVQEEVKRQLRGVVGQLEASRKEAQDLRQELEPTRGTWRAFGSGCTSSFDYANGVGRTSSLEYAKVVGRASNFEYANGVGRTSSFEYANGVGRTSSFEYANVVGRASNFEYANVVGHTSNFEYANDARGASSFGCMGADGGTADPMSRLLEGLEKVIKGGKPEELSKAAEAPKLPELSDSSSVDFGDWLYLMDHVMSDLSASSAEWWRILSQDAQEFYDKYQAADQFTRLSMKPVPSPELGDQRWSRLD